MYGIVCKSKWENATEEMYRIVFSVVLCSVV